MKILEIKLFFYAESGNTLVLGEMGARYLIRLKLSEGRNWVSPLRERIVGDKHCVLIKFRAPWGGDSPPSSLSLSSLPTIQGFVPMSKSTGVIKGHKPTDSSVLQG